MSDQEGAEPTVPLAPMTPASLFDLTGKVALVTGASSGLGERFARALAAAGATVIAAARRVDRLRDLARQHDRIQASALDVTDSDAAGELVREIVERYGNLDVLVNNAGMGTPEKALDEDLDSFRSTIEVNLIAVFNLARLAARPMLEAGGGSIVNIGSVYGLGSAWPIPNGGYTASKGGVVQITRELACQWAKGGVRVNTLSPGFFPTEATGEMVENPKSVAYIEKGTPMRRLGRAHELDGAIVFLASDASSYMTGHNLVVDGGWTAH